MMLYFYNERLYNDSMMFKRNSKVKYVKVRPGTFTQKVAVREVTEPKLNVAWTPTPKKWVVVRYRDSKAWCGPWVHNGQRFTTRDSHWHIFQTREQAEEVAMGENFEFRWDVYEL